MLPTCFGIISQSSLESSGIFRLRNIPIFNLRGQGVLIGIIDTGIDYTNPIFKYADNTTRIVSIWIKLLQVARHQLISHGGEYNREQINWLCKVKTPYQSSQVQMIMDGTMVAGIAGGRKWWRVTSMG